MDRVQGASMMCCLFQEKDMELETLQEKLKREMETLHRKIQVGTAIELVPAVQILLFQVKDFKSQRNYRFM